MRRRAALSPDSDAWFLRKRKQKSLVYLASGIGLKVAAVLRASSLVLGAHARIVVEML